MPNACRRSTRTLLLAALLSLLARTGAVAQDPWEYSPYQVYVWFAAEGMTEINPAIEEQLRQEISLRCEAVIHAPWDAKVTLVPEEYRTELLHRVDSIPAADLIHHAREIALGDKLFLLAVSEHGDGFRIQARELDCRSREFGNVVERTIGDIQQVGHAAFTTMMDTFRPLARIESTKEKDRKVELRIRAAGLVPEDETGAKRPSPILIPAAAIMQPYMRHNDRNGEPNLKVGIQKVPWTYLQVLSREGELITTQVHTGTRVPVTGKPSQRIQRFAVVIPVTGGSTTLALQSTAKRPDPLSGYDIFAKDPITDKQELIGRTDWRGTMQIPSSGNPLRLVYVRNGTQLLARLPIIPGWEAHRTVQITSDDQRLHVEGMLKGIQSKIMDILAHRTLAKARFKKRMEEGKLQDAKKLLDEYLGIETRDSVDKVLNIEQARQRSSIETVQKKIEKLFDQTRSLLTKHVNPDEGSLLSTEYEERKADAPASASSGSSSAAPTRQPGPMP
jgi:hypothetical protein